MDDQIGRAFAVRDDVRPAGGFRRGRHDDDDRADERLG